MSEGASYYAVLKAEVDELRRQNSSLRHQLDETRRDRDAYKNEYLLYLQANQDLGNQLDHANDLVKALEEQAVLEPCS